MAKISTYVIDSTPQLTDKVIGTDVNDNNITKNYTIGDIISLFPVVTNLFVPISNGVDYVDSIITQDSTTAPTKINVNGLIGVSAGIGPMKIRLQYIYGFLNILDKLNEYKS